MGYRPILLFRVPPPPRYSSDHCHTFCRIWKVHDETPRVTRCDLNRSHPKTRSVSLALCSMLVTIRLLATHAQALSHHMVRPNPGPLSMRQPYQARVSHHDDHLLARTAGLLSGYSRVQFRPGAADDCVLRRLLTALSSTASHSWGVLTLRKERRPGSNGVTSSGVT